MTIIRVIHNRENPYVQLNKHGLWDERLSLKAIGLWARCMSKPDNWEFHISEICKHTKEGKTSVYNAINELIETGYCIRHQLREGPNQSRWGGVQYIFLEFPLKDEELESFKKSLPYSCFQHPEISDPEKQPLLNIECIPNTNLPKKELKKECKDRSQQVALSSADASELTQYFLNKLKTHHPYLKEPNIKKWAIEMDRMIRLDKRGIESIKSVIDWLDNDLWYKANILSPKSLRDYFDRIVAKMQLTKDKDLIRKNRNYALQLQEMHSDKVKGLTFDDRFVANRASGKEISFLLPHESFKDAVVSLFGGRRV